MNMALYIIVYKWTSGIWANFLSHDSTIGILLKALVVENMDKNNEQ